MWKRFRPPVDFIPSLTRADRCLKTRALIFLRNNKQHTVNALVMWWRGWVLRLYHRFVLKGTPNSKITLLKLVFVYVICYGGYHRPIFSCADGYGSLGWDWFVLMGFEVNLHQDNQLVLKICLALKRTNGTDTQIFLTPFLSKSCSLPLGRRIGKTTRIDSGNVKFSIDAASERQVICRQSSATCCQNRFEILPSRHCGLVVRPVCI